MRKNAALEYQEKKPKFLEKLLGSVPNLPNVSTKFDSSSSGVSELEREQARKKQKVENSKQSKLAPGLTTRISNSDNETKDESEQQTYSKRIDSRNFFSDDKDDLPTVVVLTEKEKKSLDRKSKKHILHPEPSSPKSPSSSVPGKTTPSSNQHENSDYTQEKSTISVNTSKIIFKKPKPKPKSELDTNKNKHKKSDSARKVSKKSIKSNSGLLSFAQE
ncbi:hypothetical protein BB560_002504 [Smittium megazygosporum]|uniref:DUF4604 domain-containing protein n=1 Tax=Smittium megazygosporum TaxID=133381 RepID=A0A2T9ZEN1_9FUNG|nr:hypothetical protein BB560_002504 [Smittium megazygosporum]